MRTNRLSAGLAALLLAATIAAQRVSAQEAAQAEVQLQKAVHVELVQGNLQEAIRLYKEIVAQNGGNHAVAARALVLLGRSYEKLGSLEAKDAYERVLRDYADQADMVAQARARLSAILQASAAATPPTMAARQVWTGEKVDDHGSISPDGRYFAFPDWDSGNLGVHDFATGENRIVTSGGSDANDSTYNYAEASKWSPDGKQLAYTRKFKGVYELRITGVEGLDSRLLYRHADVYYPNPGGWSPDGRYLSLTLQRWDGKNQIGLLSVSDGSLRILKSFGRRGAGAARFSPDGEYFAYSYPPDETSRNRDLFLMAVDGSREVQLTETPADENIFGWAPDGSLLFQSNRTGRYALWMIGVENGMPTGSAIMLWADLGDVAPMGTTHDGALYYMVRPSGGLRAFTAAWNPETAEVVGPPEPVDPSFLSAGPPWAGPAWSPDGKHLAYRSPRGRDNALVIRSLQSGHETVVTREMIVRNIQWHPDGASLFVGGEYRGRRGKFQIDIRTDGTIPQFVHDGRFGIVSADGRTVYAVDQEFSEDRETLVRAAIMKMDLETGLKSELYRWVPGDVWGPMMALSPDGHEIVFRAGPVEAWVLNVVSTAGGTPRHLTDLVYRGEPVHQFGILGFTWTPDGDNIVFFGVSPVDCRQDRPPPTLHPCGVNQLYRVSAKGGDLEPAGLETSGPEQDPDLVYSMVYPAIQPNGRQISFLAAKNLWPKALWVLENFLPTSAGNR